MNITAIIYLTGFLLIITLFLTFVNSDPVRFKQAINAGNKLYGGKDTPETVFKYIFLIAVFWPLIIIILIIVDIIKYLITKIIKCKNIN